MSNEKVQSPVREFATRLIEQAGGLIEWEDGCATGTVVAPLELAHCLQQTEETFSVSTESGGPGLSLGLGGEFLDQAARVLQLFVPAVGTFDLRDLPIRKTDYQRAVDAAFGWQNSRARVLKGDVVPVAYHTWWFHVTLQSDEAWETLVPVTLNSQSLLPSPLGNLLDSIDLIPARATSAHGDVTLDAAAQVVEREVLQQVEPFLQRAEQRLERDRKRLRDYYGALHRETATPNRRTKTVPSPDEITARQRVVKLECQRKLSELNERYAFRATLRPVSLAEFRLPTLAIDVEIQRRTATRTLQVFWNGLLKRIEPLRCHRCGQGVFNLWFTNDDVQPLCNTCHG